MEWLFWNSSLSGHVQTAAGEHQKLQRSSADKHPNCLILSYPQAWLISLSARDELSRAYSSPLHPSLFPWRWLHTHSQGLTACWSGRLDIPGYLMENPQREVLLAEKGLGMQTWVSARASPRCSDPATVGSVFASTISQ